MTAFTSFDILRLQYSQNNVIPLEHDDVTALIFKALKAAGTSDRLMALNLADKVIYRLKNWNGTQNPLSPGELESMMRFVLNESGNAEAASFVANCCNELAKSN